MSEENANQKKKEYGAQAREDLRWILNTMQGKRFVYRLLESCGVYHSSFHASGSQVYFNEGERNIGLKLLGQINALDDNAFINVLKVKKEIDNDN